MKKIFGTLVVFIFILHSCSTPEQIQQRKCEKAQKKYEVKAYKLGCPWQIYDSIIVTKTVIDKRDTTIYVHLSGDTVRDSVNVPYIAQFSTPVNTLETKYSISKAWIENSRVQHTLVQKQSIISATIKDAIQSSTATKEKIVKVPYPVEKSVRMPLRWFEKILIYSGAVGWLAAFAIIFYRFRRLVFPII